MTGINGGGNDQQGGGGGWDPQRAAFLLIAAVVGLYALVILGFAAACVWQAGLIISSPDIACDPGNRLMGLLAAALAAALTAAGLKK